MGTNLTTTCYSHPGKLLQDHLRGVADKVTRRTAQKAAWLAAIFHDLGKLNPHFQNKLKGKKTGYSSHAYLSAFAWLCFHQQNTALLKEFFGDEQLALAVLAVTAMVARHHGNLPDFANGIFNSAEAQRLKEFLKTNPNLEVSIFLQCLLKHESFTLNHPDAHIDRVLKVAISEQHLLQTATIKPLDFFLQTQFGFACLIESDKRDAADNNSFNRKNFSNYFTEHLANRLVEKLTGLSKEQSAKLPLNRLRTAMRNDAVNNIKLALANNERVFTLSAPTGSGKTMMLLSLAAEIFARDNNLSIIYALPFLSITEQVENVCCEIYQDNKDAIQRIDSKSTNERIDELQKKLDDDPNEQNLKKLLAESFSEATFDHPFIITTFVQLFETLVSNRNSTLLKLPNFANTIFLIDEIQALPPRLYIFFSALLHEFCHRFNSYAIISTATMPYLELPDKQMPDNQNPKLLFTNYQKPTELLPGNSYYASSEFNRYHIEILQKENFQLADLALEIQQQKSSCLIILNTIDDTEQLYKLLTNYQDGEPVSDEYQLLNTHFIIEDRRNKLEICQKRLYDKQRIVLISTQLIEAGVDIDFPVLYRDLCPLPNLIQSAGRCNRNGKEPTGTVYLFELFKSSGRSASSLIYRDEAKKFLEFCKQNIVNNVTEAGLLEVQQEFFEYVQANLKIGLHKQANIEIDMVKCINSASFEQLGQFQLIDEQYNGKEYRYYIPKNDDDQEFEHLVDLTKQYQARQDYQQNKHYQLKVEAQLRKLSDRIVTFRIPQQSEKREPAFSEDCLGISKLHQPNDYSKNLGIRLDSDGGCII